MTSSDSWSVCNKEYETSPGRGLIPWAKKISNHMVRQGLKNHTDIKELREQQVWNPGKKLGHPRVRNPDQHPVPQKIRIKAKNLSSIYEVIAASSILI